VGTNIKDMSFTELAAYLENRKQPSFRVTQIFQWLYRKGATSFDEMSNLSAALRRDLKSNFSIHRPRVVKRAVSRDGTMKYVMAFADGETVECVLIPEIKRLTLCISTQAGCGFGCAFCATARLGFKRNLTASEMVDQIVEVGKSLAGQRRITHVVLMGMGEPLANYTDTRRALELITDTTWGLGISPRRITVSSVGLVPQIERLMADTRVNLAISLHAANDDLRGELMPVNRKYPLQQLIACCRALPIPRRKRITFEYVLLRGRNDSLQDAQDLSALLEGLRCKVNVIPFNPHPGSEFERPAAAAVESFQQVLREHGIQINVRKPRGDDIQAACGQLQGEPSALSERRVPHVARAS